VVGAGAFDEDGHKNYQFLGSTTVGPYPGEMQATWDVLRDEAAANYGMEEGWREETARDRMRLLAERTPAGVRNRAAVERKKARREEADIPVGGRQTATGARGEGDRREEGEAIQVCREMESSQENMDGILQAMAEAISEAEREATAATEDPQEGVQGAHDAATAGAIHETREANARQLASNFL